MLSVNDVARTLDHAILFPYLTVDDVRKSCEVARRNKVAAVCARPADLSLVVSEMKGSGVAVGTVIGFPHGVNEPEIKAREAALAIERGAGELDMVMNYSRFLSGESDYLLRDIAAVVEVARSRDVLVKVILEICYLSDEQIRDACIIAKEAGADFVKTSTGFGEGQATPEAVDIMLAAVGDSMGVKPAGGIKTWDVAVSYIEKGCTRLGVAFTDEILAGRAI